MLVALVASEKLCLKVFNMILSEVKIIYWVLNSGFTAEFPTDVL